MKMENSSQGWWQETYLAVMNRRILFQMNETFSNICSKTFVNIEPIPDQAKRNSSTTSVIPVLKTTCQFYSHPSLSTLDMAGKKLR